MTHQVSVKTAVSLLLLVFLISILGGMAGVHLTELARKSAVSPGETPTYLSAHSQEEAVISVVEKANPAVVSIQIQKKVSQQARALPIPDLFGDGFPFQLIVPDSDEDAEFRTVGGGSGFVIDPNGLIVTNRHVVSDKSAIYTVVFSDGKAADAKVVAVDPVLDLALIKVDGNNLPTVVLGDSSTLRIGQQVVAIGYALAELGNSVTTGIVSGVGRNIMAGDGRGMSEMIEEAIQTDAAINPGNSGGPLLNLKGEVIGINTAVSSRGQSVGFAIPINHVMKTIESVRTHGRIIRPWLGVSYVPVTPRLAEERNLSVTYGALIMSASGKPSVLTDSPAYDAGIKEGDIILEMNGVKLDEKDSLPKLVGKAAVGDSVRIKVLRGSEEKELTVTLEEFPADLDT